MEAPVLIVEDDANTAALVVTYLEREGFATLCASDGQQAVELARRHRPGFVILDVMLPKLDGWDVCRELRRTSDVPILMLTAREEELDRVLGLSLGADDYLVKPFSPRELVARVKAILRRSRSSAPTREVPLTQSGVVLEPDKCKVTRDGRTVNVTTSEYKLLHTLMSSPGRVFSRATLLDRLYEHGETVIDRVIDVHIGNLRQKIENDPAHPQLIQTVRGFGYRFAEPEEG